jgi:hypothetical protein
MASGLTVFIDEGAIPGSEMACGFIIRGMSGFRWAHILSEMKA